MKRKITIGSLLFVMMIASPLFSQDSPVRLGIRVAPNIGWMSSDAKNYSYDGITGGTTLGFVSEFYFSKNYAFSTGINYAFLNGKLQLPHKSGFEGDTALYVGMLMRKYKIEYLEVPLLLKMKTNDIGKFCFFAQVGFETGFRIRAKARDEFQPENHASVKETNLITNQTTQIREAVIIGIGTEYNLFETTKLVVGFSYCNGLNNVLSGTNSRYNYVDNHGVLSFTEISIGVMF
jgi:hypothetical protein